MIATSGFLTALECTKFVFDRGSAPDPRFPSWFKGDPTSKWKGRKGDEKGDGSPNANSWIRPWSVTVQAKLLYYFPSYHDKAAPSKPAVGSPGRFGKAQSKSDLCALSYKRLLRPVPSPAIAGARVKL